MSWIRLPILKFNVIFVNFCEGNNLVRFMEGEKAGKNKMILRIWLQRVARKKEARW